MSQVDTGPRTGALEQRVERLERERAELWQWVHCLERFAEAGLHARGLAHDMGNALTSLAVGCELALLEEDGEEWRTALAKSLTLSRTAATRLHGYIDYTSRGEEEARDGILFSSVVEDAIRFLAHPFRKACVGFERTYDEEAYVPGSRPHLLQVVVNALLAVLGGLETAGGCLRIVLRITDGEVVLDIRPDPRAEVAEGAPTPWWHQGTGLELTVSHRILASLGGRFDVQPGPQGVRIVLPATSGAERADDACPRGGRWRKRTVTSDGLRHAGS